ncbi:LysM domain-containing protein [Sphingomonas parva]|uniref:LysM domain-containing protein n=1 Tax=Sphingomonas parva TaxID=2555898 RepID=A0A4Y8ZP55_9SPHN|nr:LysM domain-containing protein [Sphingomonas parva]TFI56935.1 LysM domain-containing protein [Sphingomonas parva]
MSVTTDSFPANSRYQGAEVLRYTAEDGSEVSYLAPRIVPDPTRFVRVGEHVVTEGDRLDNIAAQRLGDAELAWRLADANTAMRPNALTETVGTRLAITLPEGLGGPPLA